MTGQEFQERYEKAMHAMQSAVALMVARELRDVDSDRVIRAFKDVRVGVNSALASQGALGTLLIRKGIITEDEYRATLLEFAEREAEERAAEARYQLGLPPETSFA